MHLPWQLHVPARVHHLSACTQGQRLSTNPREFDLQAAMRPPATTTCQTGHAQCSLPAANIRQGHYQYTPDLLHLATTSSRAPYQSWQLYRSPIRLDLMAPFLNSHPDQAFASYIHMGLLMGFRIGNTQDRAQIRCRHTNHPSALNNKTVVDDRIAAELTAGRQLGPHLTPFVHTNPLGLVPKPHQSNKWRLICDLLSLIHNSVNDGISPEMFIALC